MVLSGRLDRPVEARVTSAIMLARLLSMVLFAALFLPQAGRAHVHLCLDGAGPAISMHAPDSAEHCAHLDVAGHHDHAVEVDSPAIGKLWPPGLDVALVAVVLLLFVTVRQARILPLQAGEPEPASPIHLRPPLRGPPA